MSINALLDSQQKALNAQIDEKIKDPSERSAARAQVNCHFGELRATCQALSSDPRYSQDDIRRRALDSSAKIEREVKPFFERSAAQATAIAEKKDRLSGLRERISTAESRSSLKVDRAASSTLSDKAAPTRSIRIIDLPPLEITMRIVNKHEQGWLAIADRTISDPGTRYFFKQQIRSLHETANAGHKNLAEKSPGSLDGESGPQTAYYVCSSINDKLCQLHQEILDSEHRKPTVIKSGTNLVVLGDDITAVSGNGVVVVQGRGNTVSSNVSYH